MPSFQMASAEACALPTGEDRDNFKWTVWIVSSRFEMELIDRILSHVNKMCKLVLAFHSERHLIVFLTT